MTTTLREEANLLIIENDEVAKLIINDYLRLVSKMDKTDFTDKDNAMFECAYVSLQARTLQRHYKLDDSK
tara:strand:+ start:17495 stop:17704 length:210 start_codon:yes stop_codon:yes gene_type:complete